MKTTIRVLQEEREAVAAHHAKTHTILKTIELITDAGLSTEALESSDVFVTISTLTKVAALAMEGKL